MLKLRAKVSAVRTPEERTKTRDDLFSHIEEGWKLIFNTPVDITPLQHPNGDDLISFMVDGTWVVNEMYDVLDPDENSVSDPGVERVKPCKWNVREWIKRDSAEKFTENSLGRLEDYGESGKDIPALIVSDEVARRLYRSSVRPQTCGCLICRYRAGEDVDFEKLEEALNEYHYDMLSGTSVTSVKLPHHAGAMLSDILDGLIDVFSSKTDEHKTDTPSQEDAKIN